MGEKNFFQWFWAYHWCFRMSWVQKETRLQQDYWVVNLNVHSKWPPWKAYEYKWWPQLHYVVPCCYSSPRQRSQSCRASSFLRTWVSRGKWFEIYEKKLLPVGVPIVRNSFLVCNDFLHSYFVRKLDHGLHQKWIFLFAFFWGWLSKAFTKERCAKSLSIWDRFFSPPTLISKA